MIRRPKFTLAKCSVQGHGSGAQSQQSPRLSEPAGASQDLWDQVRLIAPANDVCPCTWPDGSFLMVHLVPRCEFLLRAVKTEGCRARDASTQLQGSIMNGLAKNVPTDRRGTPCPRPVPPSAARPRDVPASAVHPKVAGERLGHSKVGIRLDLAYATLRRRFGWGRRRLSRSGGGNPMGRLECARRLELVHRPMSKNRRAQLDRMRWVWGRLMPATARPIGRL
jgi:hypothetical protein